MTASAATCSRTGAWLAALTIAIAAPAGWAQGRSSVADPPARVGAISDIEGSVVFAPPGETEWTAAQRNRPVTHGDRVWTDDGARAELHFGGSVLQMDSGTFVEAVAIDTDAVQVQLNEGAVNARLRELSRGENFEIDTPNLAIRAAQPGDWRVDVDPKRGSTRIEVHAGTATAYGAGGGVQQLVAGQAMTFGGRNLAPLAGVQPTAGDAFDRWATERNRAEDRSVAARYIPRGVVGSAQLDSHGTWSQDPEYGTVWIPRVTAADWAPYRNGHWEYIGPWGWTWIDDAPWGFAPFHYGRWAMVGARWAWVPGPIGPHPVYAPALVGFVNGGGVDVGWYPLAPGEIWRPAFESSPMYVRSANRDLVADSRDYHAGPHRYSRRADAITAVRFDDFDRGRPVQRSWMRVSPYEVTRLQPALPPVPLREARNVEQRQETARAQEPVQRYAKPIPPATPRAPQRVDSRPWRGGEEGGYQ